MELITKEHSISEAAIALNDALDGDRYAVALPDAFSICDLTKYMQNPQRQTGRLVTERLTDAFVYFNQQKQPASRIFVDSDNLAIEGIIDFGNAETPGHKDHKTTWQAKQSPVFKTLLNNPRWGQKQFAEFLEDCAVDLAAFDANRERIDYAKAIQATRNITLDSAKNRTQTVASFAASSSAMESVSAKVDHGMPVYLKLVTPAYFGHHSFMAVDVWVAVGIATGDPLDFTTRVIGLDAIKQAIAIQVYQLAIHATSADEVLMGVFK